MKMILVIMAILTIATADTSNSEWGPLLEQLEELGNGNYEAVKKAREILLVEARKLDMPLPPGSRPGGRVHSTQTTNSNSGPNSDFSALIKSEIVSILRINNKNVHSGALTIDLTRISDLSKSENLNMMNLLLVADEIKAGLERMNAALVDLFENKQKPEEDPNKNPVEDDRKRGQGEIHFDGDHLRFEWSMLESRYNELPEETKRVWRNLENLNTELAPETRRMFEGHAMGFFDPSETNSRYRKASQKLLKTILSRDQFIRKQLLNPPEFNIFSNQTNGTYIGTNKQGQFTSPHRNYSGDVSLDLIPHGIGVLSEPSRQYKGYFSNGLPQGEGVANYFGDGECKYVGSWVNGSRHGLGVLSCTCGQYTGTWNKDKFSPSDGDKLISYSEQGCNVTWSGSPIAPSIFCDGSSVKTQSVSTEAFTGTLVPNMTFSTISCPLVVQPIVSIPEGKCTLQQNGIKYHGDCNGDYATGLGNVVISTKLFTAELNVTVSNTIIGGPATGIVNGMNFTGSVISTSFSNIKSLRMVGTLTSNTFTYVGKIVSGKFHGSGTLHQPQLNTTLQGGFVSGSPHGLCNQSSTTNASYEIATYRHGVRHGISRTYLNGALVQSHRYNFGVIVQTTEGTIWQRISVFVADIINPFSEYL
eukprot:TRINITY_DN7197_c0_g1_i1.p1 TRINITY_DN7197_c0_g1~~TRINITY_DN7197_c0_g1_i1.p1  ORF type:complete len:645 (+),score=89.92 TRINITY_DN7197_c0_g1_i1:100-2034(+)